MAHRPAIWEESEQEAMRSAELYPIGTAAVSEFRVKSMLLTLIKDKVFFQKRPPLPSTSRAEAEESVWSH